MKKSEPWKVYIVRCSDGTLYTGVTKDVVRRVEEHNVGTKGAKYTKVRRPVTLVYFETVKGRGAALSREYLLKQLSRTQKEVLVRHYRQNPIL